MRLEVIPGELEGLAHGLSGLLVDLETAGDVRSISPGAAENAELQAAVERLVVRWTTDLQDLQMTLRVLTERLDGAGGEYERVENDVTGEATILHQSASQEVEVHQ